MTLLEYVTRFMELARFSDDYVATDMAKVRRFLNGLHGHLPLHRHVREARLWAEVEDEAHRQGHYGFRGVSTPSHHWLSQQIRQLYIDALWIDECASGIHGPHA